MRSDECRWSNGKGTWPDTEGSGFESQLALNFSCSKYLFLEKSHLFEQVILRFHKTKLCVALNIHLTFLHVTVKLYPPTGKIYQVHDYAGTSLSCAGIQWWKSVSFHCWAAINLVGEISNEEEDTPPHPTPPTLSHQELRVKWDEQWGGDTPPPPHPPLVIRSWVKWDELVYIMNKNIIVQCRHTETPGVQLVGYIPLFCWELCLVAKINKCSGCPAIAKYEM